jgi:Family of unknown function (DUF6088)
MAASVAEAVRAYVDEVPTGAFIRNSDIPGPRAGVNTALSRMSKEGPLVRIRNGVYWKGVKSRFGSGRPPLLDAALATAGRGAGPSGWSATQALGLSTQVPAVPEVAVAGPVPTLDGVRFHRRNNLARRDLGALEIALLEAMRDYPVHAEVDMDGVINRVRTLAAEERIRLSAVEAVARTEQSQALHRNLSTVVHGLMA